MPASLTETLPDKRTMPVSIDLSYKAADISSPFPPDPASWNWGYLKPSTCARITAPKAFMDRAKSLADAYKDARVLHFDKSVRGDGRVTTIFWNEPALRHTSPAYDPFLPPNIVPADTHLTAEESPTGKPVHIIRKVRFTPHDTRLNTLPKNIDLRHRNLLPDQAFILRGPSRFLTERINTYGAYIKPDASARNYYKRIKEHEGGEVSYIIWCEKLDQ